MHYVYFCPIALSIKYTVRLVFSSNSHVRMHVCMYKRALHPPAEGIGYVTVCCDIKEIVSGVFQCQLLQSTCTKLY